MATNFSNASPDNTHRAQWPIGCFNRPWTKWSYDVALDEMKKAGYRSTGLLTKTNDEPLVAADATPGYLAQLKERLARSGLKANMAAIRVKQELPIADQIKEVRQQITNADFLGLELVLTFGVNKPEHYEDYYRVMSDAAAFAEERSIKLVIKPHGGGSGASEEISRCMQKVNHRNFKVWYDAANIIHYTGKDPVEELKPIAEHVTGFCAKDCAEKKGSVMIQFGTGTVDFAAVFRTLKNAGFNGPIMVESCALSDNIDTVTANARANREYLEKVLRQV